MFVGHSLLCVHVFWQLVAQKPSQQSCPFDVSQSLDCEHAFGQFAPWLKQSPLTEGASRFCLSRPLTDVQHV
jgi:hypothetical protein